MNDESLESLARRAVAGDRRAAEQVVRALERPIRAIALRMLWHPEDAADATQEILVRILTRLSQFDGRSRLTTWSYRVAVHYLLDVKKSCVEREAFRFDTFAGSLLEGLSDEGPGDAERSLLTEEVKLGCTLGVLQCLDRPHRLAYVLGEIFDLPDLEAAEAMSVSPAAYRKRRERARDAVESFTRAHCGLADDAAPCRCPRRVPVAIQLGRVRLGEPLHASAPRSFDEARGFIASVEDTMRVVELHRATRPREATRDVVRVVMSMLDPPGDA